MEFEIRYYLDSSGNNPIHEFLLDLARNNKDLYVQVIKGIEKIRNRTYHREPLSKYIEPGLWELRVIAGTDILRIVFTFKKGQIIILLHIFIKKQQKIPQRDLETARKRLRELNLRKES